MPKHKNFWIYFTLLLIILIDAMCFGLVYPAFIMIFTPKTGVLFDASFSIHHADILFGLVMAAFPVGTLLGAPLLGDISDRIGRKKVLLFCLGFECAGLLLMALSILLKSILLIVIVRFITGFMAGTVGLSQAAIVDISPEERKTVNLSFVSLAASVGFIIGPLFGGIFAKGYFIDRFGYMTPFYFASIMCVIGIVLLFIFFSETAVIKNESKISLIKGFKDLILGFTDKRFRKSAYVLMILQTAWCMYFQTITISIVQVFHLTVDVLTYYMVALCVCYAFTMLFAVRLAVKYLKIETLLIVSLSILLAGFLFGGIKNLVFIWLALIPIGLGVGLAYMALLTLFSNAAGRDSQGLAMGLAAAISSAGWFVGPLLAGALQTLGYHAPYIFLSLLIMAGIYITWRSIAETKLNKS